MLKLDQQLVENVLKIAYQAGEHIKSFYANSVEIHIKADNTPVTDADIFVSKFVSQALQELTPNIPILSEECCKIPLSERKDWEEYWIIDPLDGTQQFINRTDQFSVVIALVQKNVPVLGVIHAPIFDKTYYAYDQHGAFLIENEQTLRLSNHGKSLSETNRLHVTIGTSQCPQVKKAVRAHYDVEFIKYGSSSLKAGLVAEGKADCYIRFGDTGEWDTAAAEILLNESGGEIFNLNFEPLSYNQRETFVNPYFMMVSNKDLDWKQIFSFDEFY
ncbi:3'(2'),5'-bisphosphate nucleotidase CysQ [Otariodibacter oris]|uniref:3'(2'),5'-bisphosphate nucleotidase CysQ n=1 Tax=Otariodibacter oris TaxID=1032623 RepID=A0A420XG82_9PAST|nr:3'(2'),5'-bisphosphate nucleotidase CysQ [Otariodibacter oris]QGM80306.1 3'(2'),5'-bisphosphate nucleotidase [Otariodibacter oris]RKR71674.1 3'(2'),5'-bisphosphate nucleotidase [Otariodibacter oris]